AFAQQPRSGGDIRVDGNGVGAFDAGADRDLFEVDAEAGMALLPAGFAVVAVVDAEDGEVGRIDDGDGGERTEVHQELAVAGDDQDALVRAGERKAQTDRKSVAEGKRGDLGGR